MFGFLRGPRQDQLYRQVYAGCCSFQHRTMGVASLAFLSYEATFLYLMAVDTDAVPRPHSGDVTCCRLRRGGKSIYAVDERLAAHCSAFALLLADVKLRDDMADDHSLLARLAHWRLSRRIADAKSLLFETHAGLKPFLETQLQSHAALEATNRNVELKDYVVPTATAFGELFYRFANLLPHEGRTHDNMLFREVGELIGASLIAYDCAIDWPSDRKRGRYNPLLNRSGIRSSFAYSQQELAVAAWKCHDAFGADASCVRVLRHVFQAISARLEVSANGVSARAAWPSTFRSGRAHRAGFCDCACDCCGCDSCCDINQALSGDAMCCCCDCLVAPFDRGKKKGSNGPSDVVGKVGIASTALNPEGVAMIDGRRYPARSVEGNIDELVSVEVIAQDEVGVTVKRAQLREKKGF